MTGIDVSKHQGMIDWSKVKTDFAILRAGFGRYTSQKDPQFERNYAGAKAAGIPVGVYWYSYAKSAEEAREEAKACLQVLQGKQFEFPIYFDIEDGKLKNVEFIGGCNGNLKGIGSLVEGMDVDQVISRLEGTTCGGKPTSCPDQLATALKEAKKSL